MVTQERVKELLEYIPDTGEFFWKKRYHKSLVGTKAGCKTNNGYITISVDGKFFLAHRLAFLWMTGEIPEYTDHRNNDKSDNRWANLRPATMQENNQNRSIQKRNTSGVKNVSFNKASGKWRVSIGRKEIGRFDDLELAELVAIEAREKYHGEFARHS